MLENFNCELMFNDQVTVGNTTVTSNFYKLEFEKSGKKMDFIVRLACDINHFGGLTKIGVKSFTGNDFHHIGTWVYSGTLETLEIELTGVEKLAIPASSKMAFALQTIAHFLHKL